MPRREGHAALRVVNGQLTTFDPHPRTDEQIAVLVGPLIREIYGDSAELGHYKLAIAAYKLGQSNHQPTPVKDPKETVK